MLDVCIASLPLKMLHPLVIPWAPRSATNRGPGSRVVSDIRPGASSGLDFCVVPGRDPEAPVTRAAELLNGSRLASH